MRTAAEGSLSCFVVKTPSGYGVLRSATEAQRRRLSPRFEPWTNPTSPANAGFFMLKLQPIFAAVAVARRAAEADDFRIGSVVALEQNQNLVGFFEGISIARWV